MNKQDITNKIQELAKKIREGFILYGDALRQGNLAIPPDEETIAKSLEKLVETVSTQVRKETINQIRAHGERVGYNTYTINLASLTPQVKKECTCEAYLSDENHICVHCDLPKPEGSGK